MTINGNYDAGRVSNPFLNGASVSATSNTGGKIKLFPVGGAQPSENPWGVSLSTTNSPEVRVIEVVSAASTVLDGIVNPDYEAGVTGFFGPYVKGDPTATAFNVANSGVWDIFNPDNLV